MQVIRTIIWVLVLVAVLVFSFFNWREVEVTIWDNLVLETKVPALVIISFLLGFLPTWLISRGVNWSLNRKIRSLEIAAKANSVSAAAREADREEAARQDLAAMEPEPEPEPEIAEAESEELAPVEDTPDDEPAPAEETRLTADEPEADDAPAPEGDTPVDNHTPADAATDEDTPQNTPAEDKPHTP